MAATAGAGSWPKLSVKHACPLDPRTHSSNQGLRAHRLGQEIVGAGAQRGIARVRSVFAREKYNRQQWGDIAAAQGLRHGDAVLVGHMQIEQYQIRAKPAHGVQNPDGFSQLFNFHADFAQYRRAQHAGFPVVIDQQNAKRLNILLQQPVDQGLSEQGVGAALNEPVGAANQRIQPLLWPAEGGQQDIAGWHAGKTEFSQHLGNGTAE